MIQKDYSITLGGTDLSSSLRAFEFGEGANMQTAAAHGDDWEWFEEGLRTGVMTCEFWQDYTSGGVDDTISGLQATTFTVVWKPTSSAVSSTNPSFTATMGIESYTRAQGTIGERAFCSVTLALAADTGITRAEA